MATRAETELVNRFGRRRVFLDTSSICLGQNFDVAIRNAVARAKYLLVLIDRQWLSAKNADGGDIFSVDDWVRTEITIAIQKKRTIIPLLLDGATPPRAKDLPEDIRTLGLIQAQSIGSDSFKEDFALVLDKIDLAVPDPYLGLEPFDHEHKKYYFGRDEKIRELQGLVHEKPLVVVTGGQGSGKSSLVNVALLSGHWGTRLLLDPGETPANIVAAISNVDTLDGQLIFVDQYEEYVADNLHAGRQLLELLIDLTRRSSVRIVVTMRSGDLERVLTSNIVDEVAQLDLKPMNITDLREVITRPAIVAGEFQFEPHLVARIIDDTVATAGQLPLVEFALSELWAAKRSLTLQAYEHIGGLTGALNKHAEMIYQEEDDNGKSLIRQLLTKLARDGDIGGYVMWPRRLKDLEPELRDMALKLSSARTGYHRLVEIRSQPGHEDMVALTHISLATAWQRLNGWLDSDHDFRRWQAEIETVMHSKAKLGHTGIREAKKWLRQRGDELPRPVREYIRKSTRKRNSTRVTILAGALTISLASLIGTQVILTSTADSAALRDAQNSQQIAAQAANIRATDPATAMQLSLAAYRTSDTREARSSVLSTVANEYATQLTAHTDNVESVTTSRSGTVLATGSKDGTAALWDITNPHRPTQLSTLDIGPAVWSVAISPRGTLLAAGTADHTIRLWDITSPRHPVQLTELPGHVDEVHSVAFGRNGVLASVDNGGAARLWDVADRHHPQLLHAFQAHSTRVWSLAISPDGRTLATASWDHTVRLWDISNPYAPHLQHAKISHGDKVYAVAFGPDGHTIATAGGDDVRLWDISHSRKAALLHNLASARTVLAMAFSSDGRTLSTVRSDRLVFLWDTTDPRHLTYRAKYTGHTRQVNAVAFTPDGNTLITGSDDKTARIWDLPAPALRAHTEAVVYTSVNKRGNLMATSSSDHSAKLWNITDPAHPVKLASIDRHHESVVAVLFHPTAPLLATASLDGKVCLWDITDPRRPQYRTTLRGGHTAGITTATFSADGTTLVTGSDDRTVRLWNLKNPKKVAKLQLLGPLDNRVSRVAVGRGPGHTEVLAAADIDGSTTLWDITNPDQPRKLTKLPPHDGLTYALAISPDGTTLATGSRDHRFRLWNIKNPRSPRLLSTYRDAAKEVDSLAFNIDGTQLATAGRVDAVDLWRLADLHKPELKATLSSGRSGVIYTMVFHPDRHTLISGSTYETVRLWETDPQRVAKNICKVAYPPVTADTWHRELPDTPYTPPCEANA